MSKYCDCCKKEVEPCYAKLTDIFGVRELKIEATINVLKCPICGEELWDEQNERDNEVIIFSKYNKLTQTGKPIKF